jgi:hypothetical protein
VSTTHPIFIHIGYPKAASTSLQMNVFLQHPEIKYLGPSFIHPSKFRESNEYEQLIKQERWTSEQVNQNIRFWNNIRDFNDIQYYSDQTTNTIFKDHIRLMLDADKVNIFSYEGLLNQCLADNGLKAKRIHEFFPNAKIIIVLRNQIDILRSLYEMHPKFISEMRVNQKIFSFDRWIDESFNNFFYSYLPSFFYHETINYYVSLFGLDSIGVFLFEVLRDNPYLFACQLANFLEIDIDTTYRLLQQKPRNIAREHQIHNLREKILPGIQFSKLLPGESHKYFIKVLSEYLPRNHPTMSPRNSERIRDLYSESNKKLISEYGINVSLYNYPI